MWRFLWKLPRYFAAKSFHRRRRLHRPDSWDRRHGRYHRRLPAEIAVAIAGTQCQPRPTKICITCAAVRTSKNVVEEQQLPLHLGIGVLGDKARRQLHGQVTAFGFLSKAL